LVLGVGADDVFVFIDAWKEAIATHTHGNLAAINDEELTVALHVAFRRTAGAVFNTSFTTTVAFLACATSPIMPISSFGIYASLAIIVNYLMVMGFSPSLCIIQHKYLCIASPCCCCIKPCCPCCFPRLPEQVVIATVQPHPTHEAGDASQAGDASEGPDDTASLNVGVIPSTEGDESKGEVVEERQYLNLIQWILHAKYAPLINHEVHGVKPVSIVLVIVFLIYAAVCMSQAATMQPPTEQEEWFKEDHLLYKILKFFTERYLSSAESSYVRINMAFGITGIDRDGYDMYKPCCNRGTAQYSASFDITTAEAQTSFEGACATAAAFACTASGCSVGKLAMPDKVSCWIPAMKVWNNGTLPTGSAFVTSAKAFVASSQGRRFENDVGFRGDGIGWSQFTFYTTFQKRQPYDSKKAVFDVAEALASTINNQVVPSLQPVFQDGGREWVWMVTEAGLVNGLFIGLAICFPVAFLVLIFASNNIILSCYATFSIASIVACVLGTVRYGLSYDLGVAECIAGVIVIGFSVDYVVHLAHMYAESKETTPGAKTADSLWSMGHTVFAGAITTLGAGIMMAGTQMTFFVKMSVLISLTIFFSLFYAFFFFIPLCALMGPHDGWGDVKVLCGKVQAMICPKPAAVCVKDGPVKATPAVEETVAVGVALTTSKPLAA